MRRPSLFSARRDALGVRMTPMIDVVFLLLIFFVWTASFQTMEYLLPSHLLSAPGAGTVTEPDPELADLDRIVIRIQWQDHRPVWLVNQRRLEQLPELRQTLATVAAVKTDLPVVIDPAEELPLGYVIDVYDIARQEGFGQVQFAVMQDS